ncbi:MAG: DUF370 domain-containing protein [Lachnospiraceae bacterium]|nr:DUF370 domain-containing protein [Lachnospiraceae bacterium]
MNRIINIGYGNVINIDKVVAVIKPEAAPIKRLIQSAKDEGTALDATCGRKTKSVIIVENGTIILSALLPETIASRINSDTIRSDINE